jgi:hypothetical protein
MPPETWLKLYEHDQRALRQYMKEAGRAPRSSTNARRLRKPSEKAGR